MSITADQHSVTPDEVVTTLHKLAEQGVYAPTAGQLWHTLGRRHLRAGLAAARDAGRVAVRRVHVDGGKRRRHVALPHHAHHLPHSRGAR